MVSPCLILDELRQPLLSRDSQSFRPHLLRVGRTAYNPFFPAPCAGSCTCSAVSRIFKFKLAEKAGAGAIIVTAYAKFSSHAQNFVLNLALMKGVKRIEKFTRADLARHLDSGAQALKL